MHPAPSSNHPNWNHSPSSSEWQEERGELPDLLHPVPTCRLEREQLRAALVMAFSGGAAGGLFASALERAAIAPSSWDPSFYARDVFLQEFVAECYRIQIGREDCPVTTPALVRLLAHPPSDPAIVEYRRSILSAVAREPQLRREFEQLYLLLRRFRAGLEAPLGVGRFGAERRQLEILEVMKQLFETMEGSCLPRLAAYGRRVVAGEPFRSLSELLAFDEHLATVELKVRVGSDGQIRGFQLLNVQENEHNPFVLSPWRRWLAKLELFVRGYRFSDGEIMARLIDAVFDGFEHELVPLVQLLGDLEFYLGALGFLDLARSRGHELCLPRFVAAERPRQLEDFINPLLFSQNSRVVPCNLSIDRHDTTVLVTGPNSGGKTRLLQGLALAQLLAQSGSFVPARSASLSWASGLVVSLIQETRLDQTEGRLGMELLRIRELFERLPAGAMVILDELCSGTNPSEGEEIFELVLRMLARLRPQTFITTHFLAFAARLETEQKLAELRFLQVELGADHQPTYAFRPGVARTSLAGQAAARLGVTGEQLLSLIERNLAQTAQLTRPGR